MAGDLVKRLRNHTILVNRGHGNVIDMPDEDCVEAADRIEALERENERLREGLRFYANPSVYEPDSVGRVGDLTWHARALLGDATP